MGVQGRPTWTLEQPFAWSEWPVGGELSAEVVHRLTDPQTRGVTPETRYAKSGDVHIAYQVVGNGPIDLVLIPGLFTHVEHQWEEPSFARFLERLASFSRLIIFDARGAGLSDRALELPPMEEQMDDVLAVLEAAGSASAAFFGLSQAGPMAILFAASHPERTTALVLYATYAMPSREDAYPWGRSAEWLADYDRLIDQEWGSGVFLSQVAPTRVADEPFRQWWSRYERLSFGPGNALAYFRMNAQIDVRAILPTIRVPTLVLQRREDVYREPGHAGYLADHIPGAKLVELSGVDHLPYLGDSGAILDEVEEFLTGVRPPPEHDRVLATVLFTDIVGSTERASALGDRAWKELLERHHALVRHELSRFRGREIATAGDGFLATFDGPARAVRCAQAIVQAVQAIGMEVRAGVHTGEIELIGEGVGGIAVHIGARVGAMAAASEVLVSGTVRDLVAGSGIEFEDRGTFPLKGVPGSWRLFAVRSP
jgi:class 3 adenylate cyclase